MEIEFLIKLNSFGVVLVILFSSKQGKQKGKYLAFRSTKVKVEVRGGHNGVLGGGLAILSVHRINLLFESNKALSLEYLF